MAKFRHFLVHDRRSGPAFRNLQWKMRGEFRTRAISLLRASPLLTLRLVRILLFLISSFAMPVFIGVAQEEV